MPRIQGLSLVPIFLEFYFNETRLAFASGFIHQSGEELFLITARHNLTGVHPETGRNLHAYGGRPNHVRAWLPESEIGCWSQKVWKLEVDENRLWHEHPKYADRLDVGALPIESDAITTVRTVISKQTTPDFYVHAGADVFILGYPAGLTASAKYPVWKRGTIASEPELDIDDLPKFLVDTAAYHGMSGAAVYIASTGNYLSENGHRVFVAGNTILVCRFIGMYSSRLNIPTQGEVNGNEDQLAVASQIGVVWKSEAIKELIDSIGSKKI